ncbi:MAG: SufE family protein [Pseudonocardiaceae bacterium]
MTAEIGDGWPALWHRGVMALPTDDPATLPPRLAELAEDFDAVGPSDRVQLLLELSRELPELPPQLAGQQNLMEQVHECQSPLFLAVEVDQDQRVHLYFDAPPAAPTTRGFASILHTGLDGESVSTVLGTPDDFYLHLGLVDAVSPLRLRGMAALLARIKRNVREKAP